MHMVKEVTIVNDDGGSFASVPGCVILGEVGIWTSQRVRKVVQLGVVWVCIHTRGALIRPTHDRDKSGFQECLTL